MPASENKLQKEAFLLLSQTSEDGKRERTNEKRTDDLFIFSLSPPRQIARVKRKKIPRVSLQFSGKKNQRERRAGEKELFVPVK